MLRASQAVRAALTGDYIPPDSLSVFSCWLFPASHPGSRQERSHLPPPMMAGTDGDHGAVGPGFLGKLPKAYGRSCEMLLVGMQWG